MVTTTPIPGGQPQGHRHPALHHPQQEGRVPLGTRRVADWHLPAEVRVVIDAGNGRLLTEDLRRQPGVRRRRVAMPGHPELVQCQRRPCLGGSRTCRQR